MLREIYPKISCVTVTKGRTECVKRCINCYLQQTYPNKELIILTQGNLEINVQDHDDILLFPVLPSLSLGALRNISCEVASGEFICQWDDDDLYHPVRVMAQYKAIMSDPCNIASAYSCFLKVFDGELYVCDWSGEGKILSQYLPGSIMFYKTTNLYPEIGDQCHVQEDLNVLGKLLNRGKVAPISDPMHYLYMYHGANTYSLEHHRLTLLTNSGKKVMSMEQLLQIQPCLEQVLQAMGLHQKVTVKSLDGDAFVWGPK